MCSGSVEAVGHCPEDIDWANKCCQNDRKQYHSKHHLNGGPGELEKGSMEGNRGVVDYG